MNQKNFRKLPPFKWFVLQNFPFIEVDFDAITEWQLFCKLGEEINKIINETNLTGQQVEILTNSFNELKNYVDNYFESTDFEELVNEKLDEMAENGTLRDILSDIIGSDVLYKYDPQFTNKLNSHRILRHIVQYYDYENSTQDYMYGHLGSIYYIESENVYILGYGSSNISSKSGKIVILNGNTGEILRQSTINNLGHCNSITYNPNNNTIYAVPGWTVENEGNPVAEEELIATNTIFEIDFDTLSVNRTISLNQATFGVTTISYDTKNNKLYCGYLCELLYELDSNLNIIKTYQLKDLETGVSQNIAVYGDYAYTIKAYPNMISVFDLKNKTGNYQNLIQSYNFSDYADDKYKFGELEDIHILNENEFIIGADVHPAPSCNYAWTGIYKSSITKNIINEMTLSDDVAATSSGLSAYVNNSITNINPDGSINNKFTLIQEAIDLASSPYATNHGININIDPTNLVYDRIYLNGINNIASFSCTSLTELFTLNGIRSYKSNFIVYGAKLVENYQNSSIDKHCLSGAYSSIIFEKATFENTQNLNACCEISLSELTFYNIAMTGENQTLLSAYRCTVNTGNNKLNNIFPQNNNHNIDKAYILINGEVKSGETITLPPELTRNELGFGSFLNRFNYMYVNAQMGNINTVIYKFPTNGDNFSCQGINLPNSFTPGATTSYNLYELLIQRSGAVSGYGTNGDVVYEPTNLYIKDIWFSNV